MVWLCETTVYPVGVTTNLSCFMRIIGHKYLTVHRICTKFDTTPLYISITLQVML